MAWRVINLSLHLSSSEEHEMHGGREEEEEEEAEEEGDEGEERQRGWLSGLNRATAPWGPRCSFRWSEAKRSKRWIH